MTTKKTLDWKARKVAFVEAVPGELVADVIARFSTLLE